MRICLARRAASSLAAWRAEDFPPSPESPEVPVWACLQCKSNNVTNNAEVRRSKEGPGTYLPELAQFFLFLFQCRESTLAIRLLLEVHLALFGLPCSEFLFLLSPPLDPGHLLAVLHLA